MLDRPEIVVPVFMKVWAGSWLIASVTIERTMQISSATEPKFGNNEQIWAPPLPNCLNSYCGPKQLSFWPWSCAMGWPLVNDSGIGLPCILGGLGFVFDVSRAARRASTH